MATKTLSRTPATASAYSELSLAGAFALTSPKRKGNLPITLPGDVHSALLAAGEIPDPYFGTNEQAVMWVHDTAWTVERTFTATAADIDGYLTLTLENVDCIATVFLNDERVEWTENQFVRYDIDVTGKVRVGRNALRIEFAVTKDVAKARSDAHPFPIPFTYNYQSNGLPGVHMNFMRKAACHAGWDWGICLMPTGVYGRMAIRRSRLARQDSVTVRQSHGRSWVKLSMKTHIHAFAAGTVDLRHEIDGQTVGGTVEVQKGENVFHHQLSIRNPKLWWPNGQGEQHSYTLTTTLDGEVTTRKIGVRNLEWIVEKDAIDHSFKVRINGRDVTAMGANWIPVDALPARITPEGTRDILESAKAANMNMLRVWGGGQYEADWFYELCDELGIMIWHDFMFSCMSYPSDRSFLANVEREITQQVRRLQHHACLAIWCGDNEVIGSIGWYPETKTNRERYVANYTRLNSLLERIVEDEDQDRRFWPSSPSLGYLDFSDGWHSDTRGDTHFWQVWHEAAPFDRAREVNPRFASEFGFQSFTSMPVMKTFANAEDMNPSSPVMESHQRNTGGNARILETMTRYFRFPKNFEQMVFLSQVQQGLAIKTAIEYWRSTKPRCMGTLYWQINDIYPVASWSSLDYGGSWKLLHYMARRFYLPISVVATPRGDAVQLTAINDTHEKAEIRLTIRAVNALGGDRVLLNAIVKTHPDKAVPAAHVSGLKPNEFLLFTWSTADGGQIGENDFFPAPYKAYDIAEARVAARWDGDTLVLSADKPALFITATVDVPGYFSDNAFTLLPGRDRRLTFTPRKGAKPAAKALAKSLKVSHLRETY